MFAIGYRSVTNGEYKNEQQPRTNGSRFTYVSHEPIQHDQARSLALNEESRTQHGEPIKMNHYYIILKNGEPMDFEPRPLQNIVWILNELERGLDRLKEHSPYTIGKQL